MSQSQDRASRWLAPSSSGHSEIQNQNLLMKEKPTQFRGAQSASRWSAPSSNFNQKGGPCHAVALLPPPGSSFDENMLPHSCPMQDRHEVKPDSNTRRA